MHFEHVLCFLRAFSELAERCMDGCFSLCITVAEQLLRWAVQLFKDRKASKPLEN